MVKHVTREKNDLIIHYSSRRDGTFRDWMNSIGAVLYADENIYKLRYYINCWKQFEEKGFYIPDYVRANKTKRSYLRDRYNNLILPKDITKDLFSYQIEGLKRLELGYSYLADAMGLGKTPESLRFLELHKGATNNLIVCPSYMKEKWQNEAKRWTTLDTQIIVGTKEDKNVLRDNCTYIINYEILQYHVKQLNQKNIDIVIADETHFCKNRKTIRTKSLKKIVKKANRFIALSGTPIVNNPIEIFPILNMINPYEFYSSVLFENKYCEIDDTFGKAYIGSKNEKELFDRLKNGNMIRRTKEDVKEEFGDRFKTKVLTDMIPIHLNNYRKYTKMLKDNTIDGLQKPRLLKDIIYEGKKKAIFDYVDDFLRSGDKICLFFKSVAHLNEFMDYYKDIAIKIDGSVPTKKRFDICNRFNSNEKIKVFCGNITACGTGLDLIGSHTVGFVDLDWNHENMSQVVARCDRFGQKSPIINVHYFLGDNTSETEDFLYNIDHKSEQFSKVIDNKDLDDTTRMTTLKRGNNVYN